MKTHGMDWELRHGRYEDVLRGVACDTLIVDGPYSERTHKGHNAATSNDGAKRRNLHYAHWEPHDVINFVSRWSSRTKGWMVSITDHVLAPYWEHAFEQAGRYAFAPLPAVEPGRSVRMLGDGPSSWCWWIVVGRPRTKEYAKWGTLPGAYLRPKQVLGEPPRYMGGKPLWLMNKLVRDYSRTGDLVCDPCAGRGTTMRAAIINHRRAIGAEMDDEAYALAMKFLQQPVQPALYEERKPTKRYRSVVSSDQLDMWGNE